MITKEYLQQELAKRIDGYKRGVATTTDNIIAEIKSILVLVGALQDRVKDYDDALKRAKDFKNGTVQFALEPGESIVHYIFPELRESEDERIRKELIFFLKKEIPQCSIKEHADKLNEFVSYLEKQKEQKPAEKQDYSGLNDSERAIHRGFLAAGVENIPVGIIKETAKECIANFPWPTKWSEEDADMLNCCISSIEEAKENRYAYKETDGDTSYDREIDWLKSLRPQPKQEWSEENGKIISELKTHIELCNGFNKENKRKAFSLIDSLSPQPKAEWSEEDEKMRYFVTEAVQYRYSDRELAKYLDPKIINEKNQLKKNLFDWLRGLRPSWKPSEEQMKQLKYELEAYYEGYPELRHQRSVLESLYNDLKKL